jgi:hypothetical protein
VLHLDRFLLVEDGSQAYEFNDVPGRRVEDVIAVLRQAAATPADEVLDALRAANLCPRCRLGCPGNDYNGYADPGAFGYCGCLCHRSTATLGGEA